MVQYPNYSQMNNQYAPMNNMYVQPNNPYADRMNFLQGYQQSLQQPIPPAQMSGASQQSVAGKIVDSVDVVKATDIPMDGNIYYFPKADGTEIFCKQWQANGTTRILTFKPCLEEEPTNSPNKDEKLKIDLSESATEDIMKRFDVLESKLSEFENVLTNSLTKSSTKTTKSLTKKEGESE